MSGYKRPGSSWQEREQTARERPSSATTRRPPKERQEFFGSLAEITKKSLVAAVQNVQRCNIMGDNLWKCWVEQFGGKYNDPNKYDSDFLEAFVRSCEGVTFCIEEHRKLAAAISDGSVKRLRLMEGLPAAMEGRTRQGMAYTAKAKTAAAPTTAAAPEAAAEAAAAKQTAPPTSSPAAEQAAPTTAAAPEAAATEADIIKLLTDDEIYTQSLMICIPVKVMLPWGKIPKWIFVSAPSYDGLDVWYKNHWRSLEERSPDWKVCFIDDNMMCDMITSECNPREVRAFKALNPRYGPARADFLMRSRGGLWLDGKSGFKGILEENLAKWLPLPPLVFGHWGFPNKHEEIPEDVHIKGEIEQWFLLSEPQHPVWDEVLYDVVENVERYDEKVDGSARRRY